MQPLNSFWQSNIGYWQDSFIHNHLLVIGYTAWKGFESFERGVVICDVDTQMTHSTITGKKIVPDETFNLRFIDKARLTAYLSEWILQIKAITQILQAVDTYNPHKDIILFIKFNSSVEVNILKSLVISPLECYQCVCRRWEEFLSYL